MTRFLVGGIAGRNIVQGGGGTAQSVPGAGAPPSLPPAPAVLYPPYGWVELALLIEWKQ